MHSNRNVANQAAVGAAIGGGIISLIVILTAEPRFIGSLLAIFGTSGAIGGAICGAVFGAFSEKIGVAIGGVIGGLAACFLTMLGTLWYASTPWPSPQPYPGTTTQFTLGGGSWGPARSQTYTVTLPLETIQQYYEDQMRQYCEDAWQFEPSSSATCAQCVKAECKIRRLGLGQYFRVWLRQLSSNQTEVVHVDFWQD